ncbi:MAG: hypothetical protein OHK0056_08590 [Bacteriovoracaceae bacterium]
MQTMNAGSGSMLELKSNSNKSKGGVISKRRLLIGRSLVCDIVIESNQVSAIHAVLERNSDGTFRLYDLNSTNGTFINDKKIVVNEIKPGDQLRFGDETLTFKKYEKDLPPPPLDMLAPLPPRIEDKPALPSRPTIADNAFPESMPEVEYPLAKDPKAEFSEYIFEDADTLYPIFKYESSLTAIEVIILFKDRIFSVDYLPLKDGIYRLVGHNPKRNELEFSYLGKKDKVDFIEISGGNAQVHKLDGYELFSLSDKDVPQGQIFNIGPHDIYRFKNGDLQVYVRNTESPPKVAHAPILRRDKDFKKYLILMLFLMFSFLIPMQFIQIDKEIEKEKAPERLATILWKKKLTVSTNPAITKTEDKPKEIAQKSPVQKETEKKTEEVKDTKPADKKPEKTRGSETSKNTAPAKLTQPNKGSKDVKKDIVKPKSTSSTSSARSASQSLKTKGPLPEGKGKVDVYKSADFSKSVSSLLAKGGGAQFSGATSLSEGTKGSASLASAEEGATLTTAKVSNNVGSLSGAASGKLDSTKGTQGLVDKKSIYTAGLPFKTVILGGMDPDVIRRILEDHIPQFRYCYQKELDRLNQAFSGVVRLNFIIGSSGHVTKAGVDAVSPLPTEVKGCVVNVLRGIKFPEPQGGGVVEVNQPFNFYPNVN